MRFLSKQLTTRKTGYWAVWSHVLIMPLIVQPHEFGKCGCLPMLGQRMDMLSRVHYNQLRYYCTLYVAMSWPQWWRLMLHVHIIIMVKLTSGDVSYMYLYVASSLHCHSWWWNIQSNQTFWAVQVHTCISDFMHGTVVNLVLNRVWFMVHIMMIQFILTTN